MKYKAGVIREDGTITTVSVSAFENLEDAEKAIIDYVATSPAKDKENLRALIVSIESPYLGNFGTGVFKIQTSPHLVRGF